MRIQKKLIWDVILLKKYVDVNSPFLKHFNADKVHIFKFLKPLHVKKKFHDTSVKFNKIL